ncbi:aldo/keto reductase [Rhizobium rhizogenes]|uniref:aldo/keto reductase n=1 Tax=Rhizobium rhizogenes TaxID=359 RepID=UPI00226F912F|nr:aldo/keto reductase [Rhizobium rhizogenes]
MRQVGNLAAIYVLRRKIALADAKSRENCMNAGGYGVEIPKIGFGTYGRVGGAGTAAILAALETGYRHLDTAQTYGSEASVGEAVRRSGLTRDQVFITTKISSENLAEGKLIPSLRRSLGEIGVDQVDLCLIHWPAPNGRIPLATYMHQIVEAQALGLTRLIGVSNFTIALLKEAEGLIGSGRIATNQIELNPLFTNHKIADFCMDIGILVTCYLPIAHGRVSGHPVLTPIARHHNATEEQIAIAYELAKGYAAIPTSGRPERIRSNFAATTLRLSPQEVATIDGITPGTRSIDPDWGPDWD